jgi:hypothetical protein
MTGRLAITRNGTFAPRLYRDNQTWIADASKPIERPPPVPM